MFMSGGPGAVGEQPGIDSGGSEPLSPAIVGGGLVQQIGIAADMEPAVTRQLAIELPFAPAGITERDEPVAPPRPLRNRPERVHRARKRPPPPDIDRVLTPPVARIDHEAAPRVDPAAEMDPCIGP